MNLQNYFFPVEERDITLSPGPENGIQDVPGYKAIVRPGTDKDTVISVVKDSYRLIPNRELIEPFLEQVNKLNVNWRIDTSHSFSQLNRMRLQVTFPDLYLHDDDSKIPLSLFLHNSYDMSESVRLFFGAIRAICTNGMVFGQTIGSFNARHTSGFDFENLSIEFDRAVGKIDQLQHRIDYLQSINPDEVFMADLQKSLGKRRLESIIQTDKVPDITQWKLLNNITYHISHNEPKPKRAELQMKVSKAFQL